MFLKVILVGIMGMCIYLARMYLINKQDQLIKNNKYTKQPAIEQELNEAYDVVIMGDNPLVYQLREYLMEQNVRALVVTEMDYKENIRNLKYIFALSDKDYNNLVLCNVSNNLYKLNRTYAICNEYSSKKLYDENSIRILKPSELNVKEIYKIMKEDQED